MTFLRGTTRAFTTDPPLHPAANSTAARNIADNLDTADHLDTADRRFR
jgi:hypothetical protein